MDWQVNIDEMRRLKRRSLQAARHNDDDFLGGRACRFSIKASKYAAAQSRPSAGASGHRDRARGLPFTCNGSVSSVAETLVHFGPRQQIARFAGVASSFHKLCVVRRSRIRQHCGDT
jgi:hypothetical protein